jgi:Tat protein secretion system quality control protein TatD with DNase activity
MPLKVKIAGKDRLMRGWLERQLEASSEFEVVFASEAAEIIILCVKTDEEATSVSKELREKILVITLHEYPFTGQTAKAFADQGFLHSIESPAGRTELFIALRDAAKKLPKKTGVQPLNKLRLFG